MQMFKRPEQMWVYVTADSGENIRPIRRLQVVEGEIPRVGDELLIPALGRSVRVYSSDKREGDRFFSVWYSVTRDELTILKGVESEWEDASFCWHCNKETSPEP